ncbi:MAG: transcriptional regulator, partial [Actinobacteria bacterium]|nr:transcriptional regulator [Actinomycetota bacterium]
VFLNRIEVWNPGKLPDQISIKDLKRPHASYPTNPLIAEVLYLANYIQKAGSGTLEMIEQCRQQGLPEPNFISIRKEEFRAILSRDIFTDDYLNKLGVNERQIKAIEYIRKIGQINNTRYQELTNVSKPTATRDLQELIKKSVLQKSGVTGKGTSYRLKGS